MARRRIYTINFDLPWAPDPWGRVDPETKASQFEVLNTHPKFGANRQKEYIDPGPYICAFYI